MKTNQNSSTLYIVIPCYNEQDVLKETTRQLTLKLENLIKQKKYLLIVKLCMLMMVVKIILGN